MCISLQQQMKKSCTWALGNCSNVMSLCLCMYAVISALWAVAHDISLASAPCPRWHSTGIIQTLFETLVSGGAALECWRLQKPLTSKHTDSHDTYCGILGINYQQGQMCKTAIEAWGSCSFIHQQFIIIRSLLWCIFPCVHSDSLKTHHCQFICVWGWESLSWYVLAAYLPSWG